MANNRKTIRSRSVFDYEIIPLDTVDLDAPVVQIVEMNDDYQILLSGKNLDRIGESPSQHERGGIRVQRFDSFRDYLIEEHCAEELDGDMLGFEDGTLAEVLAGLTNMEAYGVVMGGGLLMVKEISGNEINPEALLNRFY
jgi:hypothetical protein